MTHKEQFLQIIQGLDEIKSRGQRLAKSFRDLNDISSKTLHLYLDDAIRDADELDVAIQQVLEMFYDLFCKK